MNKNYPAIALYANSHGSGQPILKSDNGPMDDEVIKAISRYDLITLNTTPFEGRPDVMLKLKELNPKQKRIAYCLLMDDFNFPYPSTFWGMQWLVGVNQPNGHLFDMSGGLYPQGYHVNFGNIPTAQAIFDLWNTRLANTHIWDGYFLDLASTDIAWTSTNATPDKKLDFVRAGFSSLAENDAARRANLVTFCTQSRANGVGIIVGNGTTPPALKMQVWDGDMFESWPNLQGGLDRAIASVLAQPGAYNWVSCYDDSDVAYSPTWLQFGRYGLASACMADSYFSYGSNRDLHNEPHNTYLEWWMDEYSITPYNPGHTDGRADPSGKNTGWLGEAVGPAYKDTTGCYIRKFPYGLVILNGTGNPKTVDLGAPYWRRIYGTIDPVHNNGKTEQHVQVNATDAVFMIALHKPPTHP